MVTSKKPDNLEELQMLQQEAEEKYLEQDRKYGGLTKQQKRDMILQESQAAAAERAEAGFAKKEAQKAKKKKATNFK